MLSLIRIPLAIIWVIFSTLVGIFVSFFRPFNPKNIKSATRIMKYGSYILGIKLELRNREIAKKNKPCIYISNHQDNLDIFPGAYCLEDNTVSIGKKNILWIPFFGIYYWLSGNILIDRKNKRSAFETMDVAAKSIRERNISVWIMPEGTRSRGKGLLPFKKGPFITAIKAQVPIVPYAWSNYVGHVDLNKWDAGTILMEVLPPIPTVGLTVEDASDLKDRAHKMINEAIKRLDAEIQDRYKNRK